VGAFQQTARCLTLTNTGSLLSRSYARSPLGQSAEDVSTVVSTHVREDHLGGLRDQGNARVVLSRAESNQR